MQQTAPRSARRLRGRPDDTWGAGLCLCLKKKRQHCLTDRYFVQQTVIKMRSLFTKLAEKWGYMRGVASSLPERKKTVLFLLGAKKSLLRLKNRSLPTHHLVRPLVVCQCLGSCHQHDVFFRDKKRLVPPAAEVSACLSFIQKRHMRGFVGCRI